MLITNINKLFKLRGITKPKKFLVDNGFSNTTAYNITHYRFTTLTLDKVEKLCLILNCTPNDLLEFRPAKDALIPENHPLLKLRPSESFNINEIAQDIPIDKIHEFKSAVDEIKSKLTK